PDASAAWACRDGYRQAPRADGGKEPAMTVDLDFERVREAYPNAGEPSSERLASLRAGLLEALGDCVPSRAGRRHPRLPGLPRWRRIVGVAALAAVAGVALLLTAPGRSTPRQATATEA